MTVLPYPKIRQTDQDSGGRPVFEIIEEFILRIELGTFGEIVAHVPAGTLTDFASVPRGLWWAVNPMDHEVVVAALIHDSLYASRRFPRSSSDSILRVIMAAYGAGWLKQIRVYLAVRLFGWLCWPSAGIRRNEFLLEDR